MEYKLSVVLAAHFCAIVGPVLTFWLWHNADKISRTRYWFVAWFGYLFWVAQTASAIGFLLDYYNAPEVSEDLVVVPPVVFILFLLLLYCVKIRRTSRKHYKPQHHRNP